MALKPASTIVVGTTAQWAARDGEPRALPSGLLGYDSDTGALKVGDGSHLWGALDAINEGGAAPDFTELGDVPASYSGQGSKLIAVKAAADGLEFVNAPSGTSIYAASVASVAALKALDMTDFTAGDVINVWAYNADTIYGGGEFVVEDTATAADGGFLIAPTTADGNKKYRRIADAGKADVTFFGALPSGSTSHAASNHGAIQAALDYLVALSNAAYVPSFELYFPKGGNAYYIDDELTVSTQLAELQVTAAGRAHLIQDTSNKGFFVFIRDSNDTDSTIHRHVMVENIFFKWASAQPITNVRANVFSVTNAPDDTAGIFYGFHCRNCEFRNGRRVFTLVESTEPDAPTKTAGFYLQTVTFEYCHVHLMSGSLYNVEITNAGGPQLTFRNITSKCGFTSGTRTKTLKEPFIRCKHNHSLIVDQIEYLAADQPLVFVGDTKISQISNLLVEDCDMEDANYIIQVESGGANPWIWNIRWINSTVSGNRWVVATFAGNVRMSGHYIFENITHSGGAKIWLAGRYGGGSGFIGWDGAYTFSSANQAVREPQDPGLDFVIDWAPETITEV